MSTEYKRVRDYELMVIFHPELSEEDLLSESGKIEGHISTVDGTVRLINREAPWGRRRLAYPIRHGGRDVRDGVYTLYYFSAESGRLVDIEREIKLQDRILRYLLTQQSAPMMEPTPPEEEAAAATAPAEGETAPGQEAPAESRAEVQTDAASGADTESPEPALEVTGEEAAESEVESNADGEVDEAPVETESAEQTPV